MPDGLSDGEETHRGVLGLGVRRAHTSPGFVPTEVRPRRSRVFTQTGPRHLTAALAGEHVGAVAARDEHDRCAGDRADVGIEQRFVARLGPPIAHDLRPRRDRDPGVDIRGIGRVDQIGGRHPRQLDRHLGIQLGAHVGQLVDARDP